MRDLRDAVVEDGVEEEPGGVDAEGPADDAAVVEGAGLVAAEQEEDDHGVDEVGDGAVEGAEGFEPPEALAQAVELELVAGYFGRDCR